MTIRNIWKLMALLAISSTFLVGCGGDDPITQDPTAVATGQTASTEFHASQSEADQAFAYIDNAMLLAGQGGRIRQTEDAYCAAFSHDKDNNTIVLDFGTEGCTGADGKTRAGKITITYIGALDPLGSNQRAARFDNYTVDGDVLNGTLTATKWSVVQGSSELKSTASATNMSMKFASDATTFSWNGTWERTIALQADDFGNTTYSITGSAAGTTRSGNDFIANITSPITYKLSCLRSGIPYAVQGIQNILLPRSIPIVVSIDYGSGACDKEVTLSINGQSIIYTLP